MARGRHTKLPQWKGLPVKRPLLGLYIDPEPQDVPVGGFRQHTNFHVHLNRIRKYPGWTLLTTSATPVVYPPSIFANGQFYNAGGGIVWFQLKDDVTGLYYTVYIHNGVFVIAATGSVATNSPYSLQGIFLKNVKFYADTFGDIFFQLIDDATNLFHSIGTNNGVFIMSQVGTPTGSPAPVPQTLVYANGRFWTDTSGFVWFQLKDQVTDLFFTPYIHNGVFVLSQKGIV